MKCRHLKLYNLHKLGKTPLDQNTDKKRQYIINRIAYRLSGFPEDKTAIPRRYFYLVNCQKKDQHVRVDWT